MGVPSRIQWESQSPQDGRRKRCSAAGRANRKRIKILILSLEEEMDCE